MGTAAGFGGLPTEYMETPANITELHRRFAIPGIAHVLPGNGDLPKIRVTSAAAAGEMYLHGAHVTSWQPAGAEEVLFVSSKSLWQDGRAIRGGVPICFPWFGDKADDPKAPAHGFVRTKSWTLDSIVHSGDVVTVSMSTASDDDTRQWWPANFRLVHRATFGSELRLELEVHNTGSSPLHFEEALHSYHRVGDVRAARLVGLDKVRYLDKTDAYREKQQQGDVIVRAETDRVYLNTPGAVELLDPELLRIVRIDKKNSLTTVVWNPWSDKARAMSDLGEDEWTQFLCIESSNVLGYAVELAPGRQHCIKAAIQITSV
jgi:glucose-6-phosphate 1-epimerase